MATDAPSPGADTSEAATAANPGDDRIERRRLAVFLGVAFGLAIAATAAIVTTGGLTGGPEVVPGLPLAAVLLATVYMFSPAAGNVLARLATGEGRRDLLLAPNLGAAWRAYLVAWLGTVGLVAAGLGLYLAVNPDAFVLPQRLPLVVASVVVIGPAINTLFAFGEEFGWRAYLLVKLRPLGRTRAVLATGVVWGVWHWPVVALGYNYGLDYPFAPVPGLLAMVLATVAIGTVFAWVTYRSHSVWPAALGHGALNAAGGGVFAFVAVGPGGLVGPAPVTVPGVIPWLVAAAVLLAFGGWWTGRDSPAVDGEPATAD